MSSPLARYSFYGKAEYNLTDDMTFYAQGTFSDVKVNQILNYAPATSFWIANPLNDANHPVPPELATLLNNRESPFGARSRRAVLGVCPETSTFLGRGARKI